MPVPTAITDLSQTPGSNFPLGTDAPSTLDDTQRAVSSFVALLRDGKGFTGSTSIAAAATTDIGAVNSLSVEITGATGITSLGTNYKGPRFLRFTGTPLLTHSASLNIPGAANRTVAVSDVILAMPNQGATGWNLEWLRPFAVGGGTGGPVSVTGGTSTAGAGGLVAITSGASGVTAAASGAINITTPNGFATGNGSGSGAINITTGNCASTGIAQPGGITIQVGSMAGTTVPGSAISITAGTSAQTNGGASSMNGGGTTGASTNGGSVGITGGSANGGTAGIASVSGGTALASGGIGGPVNITAGSNNSGFTGTGGAVNITAGSNLGATNAGNGGAVAITGGNGSGSTSGGNGGGITLTGGAGSGASSLGGDITLAPGSGSSTFGRVNFNTNSTTVNGAVATTLGSLGATAITTTTVSGWLTIKIAGTVSYIPYWR